MTIKLTPIKLVRKWAKEHPNMEAIVDVMVIRKLFRPGISTRTLYQYYAFKGNVETLNKWTKHSSIGYSAARVYIHLYQNNEPPSYQIFG